MELILHHAVLIDYTIFVKPEMLYIFAELIQKLLEFPLFYQTHFFHYVDY